MSGKNKSINAKPEICIKCPHVMLWPKFQKGVTLIYCNLVPKGGAKIGIISGVVSGDKHGKPITRDVPIKFKPCYNCIPDNCIFKLEYILSEKENNIGGSDANQES